MRRRWFDTARMLLLLVLGAIPLLADSPKPWAEFSYRGQEEIRPSVRDLRLLKEELTFDAGGLFNEGKEGGRYWEQRVRVVSRYVVEADAAMPVPFEFATTVPVKADATVNGAQVPVEETEASGKKLDDRGEHDGGRCVYRFRGDLAAGRNVIELSYPHPLGYYHVNRSGETTFRLVHRMGPLNGFARVPGFTLDVRVKARDGMGWFGRTFRASPRSAAATGMYPVEAGTVRDFEPRPIALAVVANPPKGWFEASATLEDPLPDSIEVSLK